MSKKRSRSFTAYLKADELTSTEETSSVDDSVTENVSDVVTSVEDVDPPSETDNYTEVLEALSVNDSIEPAVHSVTIHPSSEAPVVETNPVVVAPVSIKSVNLSTSSQKALDGVILGDCFGTIYGNYPSIVYQLLSKELPTSILDGDKLSGTHLTQLTNQTLVNPSGSLSFQIHHENHSDAAVAVIPLAVSLNDKRDCLVVDDITSYLTMSSVYPGNESLVEAIAGATATALCAYYVSKGEYTDLLKKVASHLPDSVVRSKIIEINNVLLTEAVESVAEMYGAGTLPSRPTCSSRFSEHTVPFCLWVVKKFLTSPELSIGYATESLWMCGRGKGSLSTNCAIVCGILASYPDLEISQEWRDRVVGNF